jgi:hypothetical protein
MHYIAQSLIAINDRSVKLVWRPNTEPDLAGYHVYMSVNRPDAFFRVTRIPVAESEYVTGILRTDRRYYFYVTAIDINGNESPSSSIVMFQLSDAVYDPDAIVVLPPITLTIPGNKERYEMITYPDFMTSFTLGEENFVVEANEMVVQSISLSNFMTEMTLAIPFIMATGSMTELSFPQALDFITTFVIEVQE